MNHFCIESKTSKSKKITSFIPNYRFRFFLYRVNLHRVKIKIIWKQLNNRKYSEL